MTDDLTKAIAELRQMELTYGQLWTAREVMQTQNADNCKSIATILNAALSGTMIPRADADLAVALMVEKAADVVEAQGRWMQNQNLIGNGFDLIQQGKVIRALVPASALAELQALRDERDVAIDSATQQDALRKATLATMRSISAENEDLRTELATLRAQVERLTGALTIAANRLHRCSVDYDTGTREFIEVGGWADEARAALTEGAAP